MGVEYRHHVIPRNRLFVPSPQQVRNLIDRLVAGRWLAAPAGPAFPSLSALDEDEEGYSPPHAVAICERSEMPVPSHPPDEWLEALSAKDFMMLWVNDSLRLAGTRYPFVNAPPHEDAHVSYEFTFLRDFSYDPARTRFKQASWFKTLFTKREEEIRCGCGENLSYPTSFRDPFAPMRIRTSCVKCGSIFDPSHMPATVSDGYGHTQRLDGGLVFRFGIKIDTDKSVPVSQNDLVAVDPEFVTACAEALGQPLGLLGEWH